MTKKSYQHHTQKAHHPIVFSAFRQKIIHPGDSKVKKHSREWLDERNIKIPKTLKFKLDLWHAVVTLMNTNLDPLGWVNTKVRGILSRRVWIHTREIFFFPTVFLDSFQCIVPQYLCVYSLIPPQRPETFHLGPLTTTTTSLTTANSSPDIKFADLITEGSCHSPSPDGGRVEFHLPSEH